LYNYLDHEYAEKLSPYLSLFKRQRFGFYAFRCPVCGDSKKDKFKCRAAIFETDSGLGFNCVNCHPGMSFSDLIKFVNPDLYNEYMFEKLGNKKTFDETSFKQSSVSDLFSTQAKAVEKTDPFELLKPVTSLPEMHYARRYIRSRNIDESVFRFTQNYRQWVYDNIDENVTLTSEDPRIVVALKNEKQQIIGYQGRTLKDDNVKYMSKHAPDTNEPLAFGLDTTNQDKPFWVFEGVMDALSVQNSVAVLNASLYQRAEVLGLNRNNAILLFDNEPGNKQIANNVKKACTQGYNVAFWNSNEHNDVNDIHKSGLLLDDLVTVYQGSNALLKYAQWTGKLI